MIVPRRDFKNIASSNIFGMYLPVKKLEDT